VARKQSLLLAVASSLAVGGLAIAFTVNRSAVRFGPATDLINAADLDQRLQRAATLALGERRGAVIVMDPQTGRIRALVNPELAFTESLPPGSTIKPFTALAALRSGVIDDNTRTLCGEKYFHEEFQTACSHPRDLPPLNPTDALAYSCNYYFGKVGERLAETDFNSTLSEFGFGRATGVNAEGEATGLLRRKEWHPQDAIGGGDYTRATPIQLLTAYAALVNGGQLFVPQLATANGFAPEVRSHIVISDQHRSTILKGLRGAVRYGTAETAALYSLPLLVFGKTGTATEIKGYRSQGWFVGFASQPDERTRDEPDFTPEKIKLAVLVFLARAHGSEAAEVARPIFADFAQAQAFSGTEITSQPAGMPEGASLPTTTPRRAGVSASTVRVQVAHEKTSRTLSLEEYVLGVVAAEGSMEREPEALKALAIASRTYALRNLGRHAQQGYDFCTTTHCQRYRSANSPDAISPAISAAVKATRDEVLRDRNGELVDSYFSASCGGATANLGSLWGGVAPPYLRGVNDEYCAGAAHHNWTDVISPAQMLQALQSDPRTNVGDRLESVSVQRTDQSGRAEIISIVGNRRVTVKGWDFKIIVGRALGWQLLKSSRFTIARSGSNYLFRGSGFGHGLGLCQEGAHVMAERGAGYREILALYFPSTHIAGGQATDLMWTSPPKQKPDRQGGLVDIHEANNGGALPKGGEYVMDGAAGGFFGRALRALPDGRASAWEAWEGSVWGVGRRTREIRRSLSSENFRISYPDSIDQREVGALLTLLESSRKTLLARASAAGVNAQFPVLEIFLNETTGDFVGRTGQPAWAAAATKGKRIELQPLATLKRRRILETTVRHELVHCLVNVISRERAPLWLAEGLALYLAGEGPRFDRQQPRPRLTTEELERRLSNGNAAVNSAEMRTTYAAAFGAVQDLIAREGEVSVWRRLAR
jgi:stage II sporulation protein D